MKSLSPRKGFSDFKEVGEEFIKILLTHFSADFKVEENLLVMVSDLTIIHRVLTNDYTAKELQKLKFNDLSVWLHKEANYDLFTRPRKVFKIICALPVSSASCERNYSGPKIIKNRLCSVLGDEVLDDILSIYMEKDIVKAFLDDDAEVNIIVEEFMKISETKAQINVL